MNITYGLQPETFKLVWGNGTRFHNRNISTYPKTITAIGAKNSTAAFQLVLAADEDMALNVGTGLWLSQHLGTRYVRVAVEAPFEAALHIIDMHIDDDNYYRADALLSAPVLEIRRGEARSVWVELKLPADAVAGTYPIKVRLLTGYTTEDEEIYAEMDGNVEVLACTVPDVRDNKFHLDLWQHLSNIARKHEVPLWSDDHFAVLEGYVKSLGELGQKAVTLVASEAPWSGQGCFEEYRQEANLYEYSIIGVTKETDGTFTYDYAPMQRYIDLCAKYGIDREISLYGLCNLWAAERADLGPIVEDHPDGLKIRYLDKADGRYKFMRRACELDDYISSLEQYFVQTGQIDKVRMAADEPGDMDKYRAILGHLKEIAPRFKFKAAINHAEFIGAFGEDVYDFAPYIDGMCHEFDKLKEYQTTMEGKRFLWYVCCGPSYPNTFLRSSLLESWFIGILTSYAGFDGFLRWNYTVWPDDPRRDIRYGIFAAGDTNFVYPGANGKPLLTTRYKAMKRGIELYELLEKLKATGDKEAVETAFGYVIREKDIRKYFRGANTLEDMCSLDYADYQSLLRYLSEKLA